jgi:hypothetical protein
MLSTDRTGAGATAAAAAMVSSFSASSAAKLVELDTALTTASRPNQGALDVHGPYVFLRFLSTTAIH